MLVAGLVLMLVAEPVYLGVQEPPVLGQPKDSFDVRAAFSYSGGKWAAMPHVGLGKRFDFPDISSAYPLGIRWHVVFAGKSLGSFATRRPAIWDSLRTIGSYRFAPAVKPLAIPRGRDAYHTWFGEPEFRPLVAISKPNFRDPDRWSTFAPDARLIERGIAAFRRLVPLDLDCESNASVYNRPEIPVRAHAIAYRSVPGDMLINLHAESQQNCRGGVYGPWESAWILLHGTRETFVGAGMEWIDAGDYDGDGASEVLFSFADYNQDGYVLLLPLSGVTATYSWRYH